MIFSQKSGIVPKNSSGGYLCRTLRKLRSVRDPYSLTHTLQLRTLIIGGSLTYKHEKDSPRNVISGICYIQNLLYPVCVKYGMGCIIVEGNSLALFTAYKAYKISHLVGLERNN